MNTSIKLAIAAAAVVVIAIVGINLLPSAPSVGGPGQSQTPTPSPIALHDGTLTAGTYVTAPFGGPEPLGACMTPPQAGCSELADDSIRITFTVPEGWEAAGRSILASVGNSPDDGALLVFVRGGWLYSDPCRNDAAPPDIPVGPTADDFASALVDHPLLEVTPPVDVELDGYTGKYVDIQAPSDISTCSQAYRPWEPGIYAQGSGHRWHLWILDVDGVRVVVQGMDYAGTSAQHRAELQSIVDSIKIEP